MKSLLVSIMVMTLLLTAGCTSSQSQTVPQTAVPVTGFHGASTGTVVSAPNIQNYDQLVRAAETFGLNASMVGPIQQPFFEQAGEIVMINEQQVQVFQFPSLAEQKQALSQVPGTATQIAGTLVVQTLPTRVWSGGNLIALYSGQDSQVINFLTAVFGPPRP